MKLPRTLDLSTSHIAWRGTFWGISSNTGCRSASATKAATGESVDAAKYGRVALAIRTYCLRIGPASCADACRIEPD